MVNCSSIFLTCKSCNGINPNNLSFYSPAESLSSRSPPIPSYHIYPSLHRSQQQRHELYHELTQRRLRQVNTQRQILVEWWHYEAERSSIAVDPDGASGTGHWDGGSRNLPSLDGLLLFWGCCCHTLPCEAATAGACAALPPSQSVGCHGHGARPGAPPHCWCSGGSRGHFWPFCGWCLPMARRGGSHPIGGRRRPWPPLIVGLLMFALDLLHPARRGNILWLIFADAWLPLAILMDALSPLFYVSYEDVLPLLTWSLLDVLGSTLPSRLGRLSPVWWFVHCATRALS
ncbi:hypothetical protein PVAP13_8NG215201 [Panicum virgatum]|uniref:Uncharacterized protein n=1 Tax=Panicum virgatum TaxID=38727 RepID=A0A8T0PDU9_PANVG|nr:hypothetical protein PVAP13_8NG215201 [Panicum virgatum]